MKLVSTYQKGFIVATMVEVLRFHSDLAPFADLLLVDQRHS